MTDVFLLVVEIFWPLVVLSHLVVGRFVNLRWLIQRHWRWRLVDRLWVRSWRLVVVVGLLIDLMESYMFKTFLGHSLEFWCISRSAIFTINRFFWFVLVFALILKDLL